MLKKFLFSGVVASLSICTLSAPAQAQETSFFAGRNYHLQGLSQMIYDRLLQRLSSIEFCSEQVPISDPQCGNSLIEAGEQCDGSAPSGFTCNNQCQLVAVSVNPVCGNGTIEAGELCDGYAPAGYVCSSQCVFVPESSSAYCGDGQVNQASEECDGQAGLTEGKTCTSQCVLADLPSKVSTEHVVINEIFSNTDSEHGSEGANEWIELYNPTNVAVDLTGWTFANHVLATSSIPALGYAFVTPNTGTSTLSYWSIPNGVAIIEVDGLLTSGGLANGGDAIELKNNFDVSIDTLSYGSNTTLLDPSPSAPAEGKSLSRQPNGLDTDTSGDWEVLDIPTPGN